MTDEQTASGIVACPNCEEKLLLESPTAETSITVHCSNCDRPLTVPVATLAEDEPVIR